MPLEFVHSSQHANFISQSIIFNPEPEHYEAQRSQRLNPVQTQTKHPIPTLHRL